MFRNGIDNVNFERNFERKTQVVKNTHSTFKKSDK